MCHPVQLSPRRHYWCTGTRNLLLAALIALLISGCATPLMDAAGAGDAAKIKQLLDEGADINEEYQAVGATALYFAVYNNASPETVKLLLERGANVNKGMNNGWRPIHLAVDNNNVTLVKLLLDHGADIHGASPGGTAQQLAAKHGNTAILKLLSQASEAQLQRLSAQQTSVGQPPAVREMAAQVTGSSDLTTAIPNGKSASRYDVAVVIGNASYAATGTPNVDYALQDAQTMRQYLTKTFGYDPANIIYVENATLATMYEIFGTEGNHQGKLYKWVKPGQSKIFIYYVGHGAPDQQSGEGYFVPVDANPQYISTSGYKLSTFYENLSKIPAAKKTVVIDACFSGSSANGQLLKGVSGLTARLKSEPKAAVAADLLLTSAGMDQVASWYPEKGHSLFTYFFLKGIQGEADSNKDGSITLGEMKVWLNDQVPYMARRLTGNEQQPVMLGKDDDKLVIIR